MAEEYLQRRRKELNSLNAFNPFSYLSGLRPLEQKPLQQQKGLFDFFNPVAAGVAQPRQRGLFDFFNPAAAGIAQPWQRGSFDFFNPLTRPAIPLRVGQQTATTFFSGIFSYLFYLSIISFFIFMILIVVHYTVTPIFKFDSGTAAPIDLSKGTSDGQLTWSSSPAPAGSSPSPGFNTLLNADYTISFDLYVNPDFSSIRSPHVVLYRSTSPKTLTATMDISKILTLFTDSNLIIYVDSMKNDLYVLTQTTTPNGQVTPEPLPVITNVPIGSPFRVGIIFTSNYVEVYINGKLEATRVLKGTLIGSIGTFYSPPAMVSSSVGIANLQYWSRILTPSELRAAGPVVPAASFFKK